MSRKALENTNAVSVKRSITFFFFIAQYTTQNTPNLNVYFLRQFLFRADNGSLI